VMCCSRSLPYRQSPASRRSESRGPRPASRTYNQYSTNESVFLSKHSSMSLPYRHRPASSAANHAGQGQPAAPTTEPICMCVMH
jgi:hypothetical protein